MAIEGSTRPCETCGKPAQWYMVGCGDACYHSFRCVEGHETMVRQDRAPIDKLAEADLKEYLEYQAKTRLKPPENP